MGELGCGRGTAEGKEWAAGKGELKMKGGGKSMRKWYEQEAR
jgi:hypothetical protein